MKLLSQQAEFTAIRGLCSPNMKVASYLLGTLRDQHFHSGAGKEVFKRILAVARKTGAGKAPEYDDLCSDPAISEQARKLLYKEIKGKTPKNKVAAKRLHERLDSYRKLRVMYFHAEAVINSMSENDSLDIDTMVDEMADKLTELRSNTHEAQFYHMGVGGNMEKLVEDILLGETEPVIPTGFKAWDDVNGGFLRGSFVVVAASTGGGKSTVANALLKNQADRGYRTCMVPLEMTAKATMARTLSAMTGIEVGRMVQGKLTDNEKKKAWKKFKKNNARMVEIESRYSIYVPGQDMTLEEILFVLKPYEYDVICIDYISLLKGIDADENSVKQLGATSRSAKIFANATDTILVMCAQLSDEGKVKYARAITENADVAWLWTYSDENRETGLLDIRTTKSRNLNPINFQLAHDYSVMWVGDVEDMDEDRRPEPTKKGDKARKRLDKIVDELNMPQDDDDE